MKRNKEGTSLWEKERIRRIRRIQLPWNWWVIYFATKYSEPTKDFHFCKHPTIHHPMNNPMTLLQTLKGKKLNETYQHSMWWWLCDVCVCVYIENIIQWNDWIMKKKWVMIVPLFFIFKHLFFFWLNYIFQMNRYSSSVHS
jgi:hypothetical protein